MQSSLSLFVLLVLLATPGASQEDSSRITDEVIPLRTDLVPEHARPLLELGDPFLGPGEINRPIQLPTGAVWQPTFQAFGTLRTAVQSFNDGRDTTTEWASRLDLFGNLQLSGTERVLIGLRPLDQDGKFTRYVWEGGRPGDDDFEDEFNTDVNLLFFEGDFGEIFPGLDSRDGGRLDYGFSVGRQQLTVQEGMLIDDRIDSLGITRNTLLPSGGSNLRVTALVGWHEIHRGDNREDEDALLYGVFSEADFPNSTVSLDTVFVQDRDDGDGFDTDAFFLGLGSVQRIGHYNTAFRALTSQPTEEETTSAGRGGLLFTEISRNRTHSDDLIYLNGFWGIDQFSSAARGPEMGGPLGRTGILFTAVGLGSYGAALGNGAQDSYGGAVGWQTFFGDPDHRRQLVLELGGRVQTNDTNGDAIATGFRYEQAFGRRTFFRLDGFVSAVEDQGPLSGVRLELQIKL